MSEPNYWRDVVKIAHFGALSVWTAMVSHAFGLPFWTIWASGIIGGWAQMYVWRRWM